MKTKKPLILFSTILALGVTAFMFINATEPTARGLSLVLTGDLHYGFSDTYHEEFDLDHIHDESESIEPSRDYGEATKEWNQGLIKAINNLHDAQVRQALSSKGYNPDFKGLVVLGDLTDTGESSQWQDFKEEIGLSLPNLPVLEMMGNHDYPLLNSRTDRLKSAVDSEIATEISSRNASRGASLIAKGEGGQFAMKWGSVLLINLGVKPSNYTDELIEVKFAPVFRHIHPFNSLSFLQTVLKKYATPTTKVLVSFHYPPGTSRMTYMEKRDFFRAIKPYNVIAILHAHQHRSSISTWCGIPVIEAGSPTKPFRQGVVADQKRSRGEFTVLNITSNEIRANTVTWSFFKNGPSDLSFDPASCTQKTSKCFSKSVALNSIKASCPLFETGASGWKVEPWGECQASGSAVCSGYTCVQKGIQERKVTNFRKISGVDDPVPSKLQACQKVTANPNYKPIQFKNIINKN